MPVHPAALLQNSSFLICYEANIATPEWSQSRASRETVIELLLACEGKRWRSWSYCRRRKADLRSALYLLVILFELALFETVQFVSLSTRDNGATLKNVRGSIFTVSGRIQPHAPVFLLLQPLLLHWCTKAVYFGDVLYRTKIRCTLAAIDISTFIFLVRAELGKVWQSTLMVLLRKTALIMIKEWWGTKIALRTRIEGSLMRPPVYD